MSQSNSNTVKNVAIGIIIAIMAAVIIVLFCIAAWLFFFCSGGIWQEYTTVKISEYGKWDGHIDNERQEIESGLYIFPEDITNALDVNYFYYTALDFHSISTIAIFAEVTYSEEDYQIEKERIAGLQCEIPMADDEQAVTNLIAYSEELFFYPAYIAVYNSNLSYEYALMDEESNKIIYVYSKLKDLNGMIPDEYIPIEVIDKNMYENNSWDNINIYYAEDENGNYRYFDSSRMVLSLN